MTWAKALSDESQGLFASGEAPLQLRILDRGQYPVSYTHLTLPTKA